MKMQFIAATTHVDAHNERITYEALQDAAERINTGNKPRLTIEHDMTIPPYGKMLSAYVEPRDDGEYQLVCIGEAFENTKWIYLSPDIRLFHEESEIDLAPFTDKYEEYRAEGYEIAVDHMNFDSFDAMDAFFDDIKAAIDTPFEHNEFGRKAAVPDPEIIIKLAHSIVGLLLTSYIAKKVGEKIIDKLGEGVSRSLCK